MNTKILISVLLIGLLNASLHSADEATTIAAKASQETLRAKFAGEEWTYEIEVKNKGTRSEAWLGVLTKNAKRISGKNGEVIESPFGKLAWFGVPESSEESFTNRGWLSVLPFGRRVFDDSGKRIQK